VLPPRLGPRGEGWVLGQIVLFWLIAAAGVSSVAGGTNAGELAVVAAVVGSAMIAGGVIVAARGILDLGRNRTPLPQPTARNELIERGVYRLVRHPIYSGLVLAAIGWGVLTMSGWAVVLALVLLVWLDLKSRREEAWLMERHPAYAAYRARTRRFVPGLY
jgi:protein-S-isoprenylcysteine O-methyltransferase Ste14